MSDKKKPLVYSCSGCSNVAQLANNIALELDARNVAQMSCIAGVGGKVKGLVKMAESGRPIIALDGCFLHCVKSCLSEIDVSADLHIILTDQGVKKRRYDGSCVDEVTDWCDRIERTLADS